MRWKRPFDASLQNARFPKRSPKRIGCFSAQKRTWRRDVRCAPIAVFPQSVGASAKRTFVQVPALRQLSIHCGPTPDGDYAAFRDVGGIR